MSWGSALPAVLPLIGFGSVLAAGSTTPAPTFPQILLEYVVPAALTVGGTVWVTKQGRSKRSQLDADRDRLIKHLEAESAAKDARIRQLEKRGDRLDQRIGEMADLHPHDPKRKAVE